jgi:SNF2 family DNA or RNA helicase
MWKLQYSVKGDKRRGPKCTLRLCKDGTIGIKTRPASLATKMRNILPLTMNEYDERVPTIRQYCKDHSIQFRGVPVLTRTFLSLRPLSYPVDEERLERCPPWNHLYAFQKEGVRQAIHRNKGCVLLYDEMGLGKTVQALTLVAYYMDSGRLLVVCPSYLRLNWKTEAAKWGFPLQTIQVFRKSTDVLSGAADIVIVSYGLLTRNIGMFRSHSWGTCILDESHYIKNRKALRTKAVLSITRGIPRRICLSGTPALSRPAELFTQLHMVIPSSFPSFKQFSLRYCDAKMGPFGWDVSGASHKEELSAVMKHLMIRRLKQDVLTQLPPKVREDVHLSLTPAKRNILTPLFDDLDTVNASIFAMEGKQLQRQIFERKRLMSELYHKTAEVKVSLVCDYLQHSILPGLDHKVLVFAHHQVVLDALTACLTTQHVGFIRMDGKTPQLQRPEMVEEFRNNPDLKVALLSQKACGTGLNFTMASHVIFAELNWNPGELLQCEDRTHRIGQQASTILIQYLIAEGSLDPVIWKRLHTKFQTINSIIDGGSNKMGFDSDRQDVVQTQPMEDVSVLFGTKMGTVHPRQDEEPLLQYVQRVGFSVTKDFVALALSVFPSTWTASDPRCINLSEGGVVETQTNYFALTDSVTPPEDLLFYDGLLLFFATI